MAGVLTAFSVFPVRCAAQDPNLETNLKAAFLYNFTKYIDWPADPGGSEFVIGIIGPSDIEDPLQEIARTGTVGNKKIVVRRFDKLEQLVPCQVLFISRRCKIDLAAIMARVNRNELTIGEVAGAARRGVMFNFVLPGDKLRFEVNLKSLSASGLKVSSQLLKLAIVVNDK